jgi:PAS domain S-box-containing protein
MLTQEQKDFYEAMNDGVYIVDRKRTIVYWNKAAERISGYTAEEVIGKSCADNILIHVTDTGVQLCTGPCPMSDSIHHGKPNQAHVYLHHKEGHRVPIYVRTAPFLNQANSIVGGIELFTEEAPRLEDKKSTQKSQHAGQECVFCKLPNRDYMQRELETDLADFRNHGYKCGLILFQVKNVEELYATHGEEMTKGVLKMISRTIAYGVRPFDVIGCWSNASFLGIFTTGTLDGLQTVATRVMNLVHHSKIVKEGYTVEAHVACAGFQAHANDTADGLTTLLDTLFTTPATDGREIFFLDSKS